ncbi:MAG: uL15 family ribosomal protein [Candidatus Pacearchaeota archaeon]
MKWRGDTTYGHGARKKWKGSGHHGGVGMAGTGKRADHKKSLVIKLYGNNYFGKQGVTSRKTEKDRSKSMNLEDIRNNLESLMKKYGKNNILELKKYKILGKGELKDAIKIKALGFSEGAKEKIEKSGGEAILIQIEHKRKVEEKINSKEEKPKIKKVILKKKK